MAAQKRMHSIDYGSDADSDFEVKIIMSSAIKREPKSPICVVGIGIKS